MRVIRQEAFGRVVALEISEEIDHYGQFSVVVAVDDKIRYKGNFTDKSYLSEVTDRIDKCMGE